ncbi:MAG: fibrillarin-like rRNA/tRNA 2'-O-methyltransferase [Candidatus Ranarchaeia archaeon]
MRIQIEKHNFIPNVVWARMEDRTTQLATVNFAPGTTVYDEKIFKVDNVEYRTWNPHRSKLGALIQLKISKPIIKLADNVLYLGAASGTTASHVSDIVGKGGMVYAVEFAARTARDLLPVSENRANMIPILADAHNPEIYSLFLTTINVIYQDIAQPDQAEIAVKNADMFLKEDGYIVLAVKSRSIDTNEDPEIIYKQQIEILEKNNYKVIDKINLDPFEKDHAILIARKK